METKKFRQLQPALKFAGVLGTVGGFVADVLSPLGSVLTYLLYLSIFALIFSIVLLLLLPAPKKELFKTASVTSFFFALIFGVFGQVNKGTDNGFLGDNLEFISKFQSDLNIIDAKLDNISNQIEAVDEKITNIDEKLDVGFDNLSDLIKTSNPIQNPSTPKDFLVNAYLYRNGGDLNKSEESFNSFFDKVGNYKIDVLADFAEVMRNNKGKNFVKSYFETQVNLDDEVFKLFKTIFISEKSKLIDNIQKLNINQNIIDFGLVYVTNNASFWNDLGTKGAQLNDSNLYIRKAIELSLNDSRLRTVGLDELDYLIVNKQNFGKLIYNQANPYDRQTLIQFYFGLVQNTLSGMTNNDPRIESEKKAFLGYFAASKDRVVVPDSVLNKDSLTDNYEIINTFNVEKFGEKFYVGQSLPLDNGLELWNTYLRSRDLYNNL